MATRKPARMTAVKAEEIRLPTLVELHQQLEEQDRAVKAAKVLLRDAKTVRDLVRTAIAEKIEAELRKQKKDKKAAKKKAKPAKK